jgi:hypothetical protein
MLNLIRRFGRVLAGGQDTAGKFLGSVGEHVRIRISAPDGIAKNSGKAFFGRCPIPSRASLFRKRCVPPRSLSE